MRAHEVPVALDVVARLLPEVVRIAHGREHVMRLHAVVAVVRAQGQKLGQVAVPRVEVHRHGALAHAQLVHRHGRVVRQADPSDDAAGRPVEAANGAARRAHLAEVQAHAAAVLAHLREVVDAAVDAVQAVGHRVDEARRQLVERLARVRQRGRGHGHLQRGQHVVEAAHPPHALGRALLHGEVQRDAEEHLLRRLQRRALMRADDVAVEQKLQAGVGEQVVAAEIDEAGRLVQLGGRVMLQDVVAVQALLGKEGHLLRERLDVPGGQALGQRAIELHHQQARGDDLPARRLLRGQLHRRLHQHGQQLAVGSVGLGERLELGAEVGKLVLLAGELLLHRRQHARQRGHARQLGAQTLARGALAGAVLAVQDVAFQLLVMVRFHEGALHEILHVLHRDGAAFALLRARHRALDARDEAFGLLVVQNRAHAGEGRAHGALDLAGLVGFHGAVALGNLHDVVSPFVLRLRCVLRANIVAQYVTKIATYWGTDRQRAPHRRRRPTRRARKKKRQATQDGRPSTCSLTAESGAQPTGTRPRATSRRIDVRRNRAFGSLSPVSFAVSKPQENATWGFSSRHSGQKPDDCQKPDFAAHQASGTVAPVAKPTRPSRAVAYFFARSY